MSFRVQDFIENIPEKGQTTTVLIIVLLLFSRLTTVLGFTYNCVEYKDDCSSENK